MIMCRTMCSTFPQCEFNRDLLLHTYLQRYYFVIYNRNTDVDHYYLWYISVYEKLQATRAKVAPVNSIYGSHFSATEATYKVSQNIRNFVEFTRITHKPVPV